MVEPTASAATSAETRLSRVVRGLDMGRILA
jgi:hypothetical protein